MGVRGFVTSKKVVVACVVSVLVLTSVLAIAYSFADATHRTSWVFLHNPEVIDGNEQLSSSDWVTGGKGTSDEPYLMDGVRLLGYGVQIKNTTVHTIVSNMTLHSHGDGISLDNVTNFTVRDSTIDCIVARRESNDARGNLRILNNSLSYIEMWNCTYTVVSGNALDWSPEAALALHYCHEASVTENLLLVRQYLPAESQYSMLLDSCSRISLDRNRFVYAESYAYNPAGSSHDGVAVENSTDIRIVGSVFEYATVQYAIRIIRSSNVEVDECRFILRYGVAISVESSLECLYMNNRMIGLGEGAEGVVAANSTNQLIESNRFEDVAVTVKNSDGVIVAGNQLLNRDYTHFSSDSIAKILAMNVTNTSVVSNLILQAYSESGAICVSEGNTVNITGNIVRDCVDGGVPSTYGVALTVWNVENVTISRNRMADNDYHYYQHDPGPTYQVAVSQCDDVIIEENYLDNDSVQIYLTSHVLISRNTLFRGELVQLWAVDNATLYGNNFLGGCSLDLISSDNVSVDAGYPVGGNHWGNMTGDDVYSGPDQDLPGPDGIIDTPLPLGVATDRYPLVDEVLLADESPPFTVVTLDGDLRRNGWFWTNISVNLTAFDSSGNVESIYFRIDGGESQPYSSEFVMWESGKHLLEFYAVDDEGNACQVASERLWIDRDLPVIIEGDPPFDSTTHGFVEQVTFSTLDYTSGIAVMTIAFWSSVSMDHPYPYLLKEARYEALFADYNFALFISVEDEAGHIVSVVATYTIDADPLSINGPYGPWFVVAIAADIVLLTVLVAPVVQGYRDRRRPFQFARQSDGEQGTPKGPETKYDLEEGFEKYKKR